MISVIGEERLIRRLAKLGGKDAKKYIKKAAKESGKTVKAEARSRTPKDTGAMSKSYRQRQTTYKHKVGTGKWRTGVNKATGFAYTFQVKKIIAEDVGNQVYIDQDSLKRQASKGKHSVKIKFAKKRSGKVRSVMAYFYPAAVELGTRKGNGKRPLTKSLFDSKRKVRKIFIRELRRLLNEASRGPSLPA